jgi:hypothetical protein
MKKKIPLHVWDCDVFLFTDKASAQRKLSDIEIDPDCDLCTWTDGRNAYILIDMEACSETSNLGLVKAISHESNHAAMHTVLNVGQNIDRENQEPACYTQDYIFGEVLLFIAKNHRPELMVAVDTKPHRN